MEIQRSRPDAATAPMVADLAIARASGLLSAPVLREHTVLTKFLARFGRRANPSAEMRQELARRCMQLAHLDVILRAGHAYFQEEGFLRPGDAAAEQVLQLLDAAPVGTFTGARRIVLNPTFGSYSLLVGGADADLVCDGRLIDVKTTQRAVVERDHIRQLLGYFLLARWLHRAGDRSLPPIQKLEIYFSRYAATWRLDASEILASPDFAHHEVRLRDVLGPS